MPHVATLTLGDLVAAEPREIVRAPERRRRVSQIVGRHADRSRPFVVSVHSGRQPLQPYEDTVLLRREWRHRYLGRDDTVVITYLPQGGSAGKIGIAIAAAVLVIAAPYAAPAIAGALELGALATTAIQAGLVIGGAALLSYASRSKAQKDNSDTRPVYGVSGGGNLPRPGDRIPRVYGLCWTQPDLAQPDYSIYSGENQILYKRMVVSAGTCTVKAIRAGQQTVWTLADGFHAPFTADNVQFEVLHGEPSQLVPSGVVEASAVAGAELPRPSDNPDWAGPFALNRTGPLITSIAVSYQFPQGISGSFKKSGVQVSNQPGLWGLEFQFAPIDAAGNLIGPWQAFYAASSATIGPVQSSRPIRQTATATVAAGRYAVRGRNTVPDNTDSPLRQDVNTVTWDGLTGFWFDGPSRPDVTELTMRITSEKALSSAAFGQIDVQAQAVLPVWTGSAWVSQETRKAVWAYCDVLRNGVYGGGLPDSRIDVATPLYYADALDEFDTFDGAIRGPVSVFQAASTVLLPMRAEPSYLGRVWSLVRDEPRAVAAHVITRRQIAKGSTKLGWDFDATSGVGHVIGEFSAGGDFRSPDRTPDVVYGEASLTPTRVTWQGVSDFDHAIHLTRWRAASGFYRRRKATVTTEHDARLYARGDGIRIDAWFTSGAAVAAVIGRSGDTLTFDADVPVAANDNLILRDRRGREWGPVAIAGQGASARVITLVPSSRSLVETATGQTLGATLAADGEEDTVALVGPLTQLTRRYIVRSVQPSGRDRNEVVALVDDDRVWTAVGVTVPGRTPVPDALTDPAVVRVPSLKASSAQGTATRIVQWSLVPARGADLYRVQLSYDGANSWSTIADGSDLSGTADLMPTQAGVLDIRAQARAASSGLWGVWTYASFSPGTGPILAFDARIAVADLDATLAAIITGTGPGSIAEAKQAASDALGRLGTAEAAIVAESSARNDADLAQASTLSGLTTRLGSAEAAAVTESQTRTTADSALSSRTDALVATVGENRASLDTFFLNQVGANGSFSSRLDNFDVNFGSLSASVTTGFQASSNQYNAVATALTQVSARTDGATASGRFSASARAGANGTDAIVAMQVSRDPDGSKSDAGIYLGERQDGSTYVLIDADKFLIGGQGAFVVEGGVLHLKNALIAPGAIASAKQLPTIQDEYLGQGQGTASGRVPYSVLPFSIPSACLVDVRCENLRITFGGSYNSLVKLDMWLTVDGTSADGQSIGFDIAHFVDSTTSTGSSSSNYTLTVSPRQSLSLPAGTYEVYLHYAYQGFGVTNSVSVSGGAMAQTSVILST